ncbi:MAG: 30S ribosomal protein S18 [Bacteriovoracaceae bacterium]|nr:30S ribosomal protein S18 [Bacteriovoracaceae bacterium]
MIYETAIVVKPDATEEAVASAKNIITETVKEFGGEILVSDAWGVKTFAQAFESGLRKGNFFYFMYQSKGTANMELERKLRINEGVVRSIIVKLGDDSQKDEIVKNYKNPNHTQSAAASANIEEGDEGGDEGGGDKEKRMYSKRKSCYFSAMKTSPDWKDPKSYGWLVNEFGKISPARITGLTPKFQRKACDAIKRGRAMGLISYTSGDIAR